MSPTMYNRKLDKIPEMNALQLKMARTALGLTVRQAAELAGCSHETIVGIEAGRSSVKTSTIDKVQAALEKAGVEFLDDGQGVRLKPPKLKRKAGSTG
jgi:transcriptional regulator with XRE-family HTH domain